MKTTAHCLSCIIAQAVNAMRFGNYAQEKMFGDACRLLDYMKDFSEEDNPAYNTGKVLTELYRIMGNDDPYASVKSRSNREALRYYPYLKEAVDNAGDRLFTAFQAAVAGNIIDLGIRDRYDLAGEIDNSMGAGFACNDYQTFKEKLKTADSVLIISDNSGEILFDKLLVEELRLLGKAVTYMVKGKPLLNDACLEDAVETGMDKIANMATTGARNIGFDRRQVSPQALALFRVAPLVVAKGMANFETLSGRPEATGKTFCILKAKCEVVAAQAGVLLDDLVFTAI